MLLIDWFALIVIVLLMMISYQLGAITNNLRKLVKAANED